MSTSDGPRLEELRALRTRAYGPHADIHEDPAALARLRELEARATGQDGQDGDTSIHAQAAEPRAESAATGESVSADAGHTSAESGSDVAPAMAVESPAWWRRIPVVWTAAGVVVGIVLGIGVMLALQPAASDQVAVLQADPDAEWPNEMFGVRPDDGQRYNEFHGLTVITYDQSAADGASLPCLAVLTSPNGAGFAGAGCGAGPFPATVSLQIHSLLPQELRDQFPEGTSLQFVHDGAQVQVHASQPITARPTP
ncbi:hypothetical protein [Microbacterium sp. NPDC056569]|uniref:hypothetical protein n=1 Tax=Microbacterium sp. NPDC056569 TaxID=3345867 RepID=UPI00366DFA2D